MRTDWVEQDVVKLILALMFYENSLVIELCIRHGMRVSDALKIKTKKITEKGRYTYFEQKTKKRRTIVINQSLKQRLLSIASENYVFSHRLDYSKHRTRQAVYKDIKRVSKMLRLEQNVATHTARKVYAVERFRVTADIKHVARLLNHDDEAVTMIYALADEMTKKK